MKIILKEACGYGAASGCALIVDVAILWMLVRFYSWHYLAAATISFLAGASVAYVLSVRLAFKQHRLRDRHAEFIGFVMIGVAGLALNAAIMSLAVRYFGLNFLLAKCVAAACTFTCNFVARRQILFAGHSTV